MYIDNIENREGEMQVVSTCVPSNGLIGRDPHQLHPPDLSYMRKLTARCKPDLRPEREGSSDCCYFQYPMTWEGEGPRWQAAVAQPETPAPRHVSERVLQPWLPPVFGALPLTRLRGNQ